MTLYQFFLLMVLVAWPLMIFGVLFLMSKLENYVKRLDAADPTSAGLEPVEGTSGEREVKVLFGGTEVGNPPPRDADTGEHVAVRAQPD